MKKTIIIMAVLAALLGISLLTGYNNLVAMNEGVNGKWSQVENQLQRRSDLIPNLVGTVKGFAAQEKAVIEREFRPGIETTERNFRYSGWKKAVKRALAWEEHEE